MLEATSAQGCLVGMACQAPGQRAVRDTDMGTTRTALMKRESTQAPEQPYSYRHTCSCIASSGTKSRSCCPQACSPPSLRTNNDPSVSSAMAP